MIIKIKIDDDSSLSFDTTDLPKNSDFDTVLQILTEADLPLHIMYKIALAYKKEYMYCKRILGVIRDTRSKYLFSAALEMMHGRSGDLECVDYDKGFVECGVDSDKGFVECGVDNVEGSVDGRSINNITYINNIYNNNTNNSIYNNQYPNNINNKSIHTYNNAYNNNNNNNKSKYNNTNNNTNINNITYINNIYNNNTNNNNNNNNNNNIYNNTKSHYILKGYQLIKSTQYIEALHYFNKTQYKLGIELCNFYMNNTINYTNELLRALFIFNSKNVKQYSVGKEMFKKHVSKEFYDIVMNDVDEKDMENGDNSRCVVDGKDMENGDNNRCVVEDVDNNTYNINNTYDINTTTEYSTINNKTTTNNNTIDNNTNNNTIYNNTNNNTNNTTSNINTLIDIKLKTNNINKLKEMNNDMAFYMVGKYEHKKGNLKEATEWYKKALNIKYNIYADYNLMRINCKGIIRGCNNYNSSGSILDYNNSGSNYNYNSNNSSNNINNSYNSINYNTSNNINNSYNSTNYNYINILNNNFDCTEFNNFKYFILNIQIPENIKINEDIKNYININIGIKNNMESFISKYKKLLNNKYVCREVIENNLVYFMYKNVDYVDLIGSWDGKYGGRGDGKIEGRCGYRRMDEYNRNEEYVDSINKNEYNRNEEYVDNINIDNNNKNEYNCSIKDNNRNNIINKNENISFYKDNTPIIHSINKLKIILKTIPQKYKQYISHNIFYLSQDITYYNPNNKYSKQIYDFIQTRTLPQCNIYIKLKEAKTITDFKECLNTVYGATGIGICLSKLGRFKESLKVFYSVVVEYKWCQVNIGNVLCLSGEYEKAVCAFMMCENGVRSDFGGRDVEMCDGSGVDKIDGGVRSDSGVDINNNNHINNNHININTNNNHINNTNHILLISINTTNI
ncbi:hypothetical protein NAPIS_ORF00343 [Vairimorpha apis BRL 01]|uniref:Uncharacterized protein n=1 Tax=Vairimorpha apis BRL 01 TaxID=1037528 RepID=T0LCP1_9MICR|nr:hypothetical protein NAPIS_ORF00343 [Vairimorpha apis BRL 01]